MDSINIQLVFYIIILIISLVIHEISHAFAAYIQGDPTPKYQDRLTLNPIKHLELVGSFLVPLITYFGSVQVGLPFVFGWAKPVEYNPYNLKNQRWGELWIALAGPLSNFIIAIVFGLFMRFGLYTLPDSFLGISVMVIFVNLGLAVFNLVPIPPLDGSKILFNLLPYRFNYIRQHLEQYSFILVLVFIFFFSQYLGVVVNFLFRHLTGVVL